MTDTLDDTTQEPEGSENANIRRLRERAEAATAAELRAVEAERKLAILESGIDTSSPMAKFFIDHYEGDITDTETLKARAAELGITFKGETATPTQEPAPEPEGGPVNLEPTGTEQRRALAGEDAQVGEIQGDPKKEALEQAEQAISDGARFEEAAGHFVSQLASAAIRGDQRVIIDESGQRSADGTRIQRWR